MSTKIAKSNVEAIINSYGTFDLHYHVRQTDTISLNAKLSLLAHIVKSQGLVQNSVRFFFSQDKNYNQVKC